MTGRTPGDVNRVLRHAFANLALLHERLIGRRQALRKASGRSEMRVSSRGATAEKESESERADDSA